MTGGQFVDRRGRNMVEWKKKRWPARLYDLLRFAAHISAVGDNVRGRREMMLQTFNICDKNLKCEKFCGLVSGGG